MNEKLKHLALSDNGFVFDPNTGNTFTLNETGLFILRALMQDKTEHEIKLELVDQYETDLEEVSKDLSDLIIQLQELGLRS